MDKITVKAPAKINLTLDVLGRRENGYHDLRMIMQTIDLCDEVTIEQITAEEITLSMNKELPDGCPMQKNLVYRAAILMKERYALPDGMNIILTKNIPAAAGLAGGSSDCAATLLGINELYNLDLSLDELCDIGVTLPALEGAFTMVMGHHSYHHDTSAFPYSYLIEKEGRTHLMPGANLTSFGAVRDIEKWPARDRRDRKSTRLNSSHRCTSRMPSSA